mmetsp:Transcript_30262/g.77149  ORF Transcript_30262/g.77149 Transcript_30262/m.77149 type:complete len:217 (+) Transcript_30262:905-1555(+)
MSSWPTAMRSSAFTSLAPPRSAAHFMAPSAHSGRWRSVSGNSSLLGRRDAADALSRRNSLSAAATFCCSCARVSSSRDPSDRSTASLASSAALAAASAARYRSPSSFTTGTDMVCTLMRRSPWLLVYSSAHCTYATGPCTMFSSCAICTANALSGSHVGRASRSVERLKKWPWKDEMRRPLEQRMRMTASHAVGRSRLCSTSAASLGPSRAPLKPG